MKQTGKSDRNTDEPVEQTGTATVPSDMSTSDSSGRGLCPVLLLCQSPGRENDRTQDRIEIVESVVVGRRAPSDYQIKDAQLSRTHFRIDVEEEYLEIEDLDSTNGTYINGKPLNGRRRLVDHDVIRAGRCLFVCRLDGAQFLRPRLKENFGIIGRFYAAVLVSKIERLASSSSNVLLVGPTGCGKELATDALGKSANRDILRHNCGKFSTEDDAAVTLFGVGKGVFTNIDARPGLIERADGKILFLDEAHNLSYRTQNTLLRVLEDWTVSRFGEKEERRVDVKFVLASNDLSENRGLKHDLYARLRELSIPPLAERRADIPSLFNHLVALSLMKTGRSPQTVLEGISVEHYESLCLDGFEKDNVRGLRKLADDIVTEIEYEEDASKAIKTVFKERYGSSVSRRIGSIFRKRETTDSYDRSKGRTSHVERDEAPSANVDSFTVEIVEKAYRECRGVVSAIADHLRDKYDVKMSRQRIAKILDAQGLTRMKRRR